MAKLLREVFSNEKIKELAERITSVYPDFQADEFIHQATDGLSELNYAERIEQITDALYKSLPKDYDEAISIITKSHTGEIEYTKNFKFRDEYFINLPLCRYVSKYGLDYFDISMNALKELTKSFTSEYDIRYFVEKYPVEGIELMTSWADDADIHVRRLASEGSRPRLPMGKRLHIFVKDPSPILPILEKLKDDPTDYVHRSVANSINDISKDHPDTAAEIAERWAKEGFHCSEYVCRHAMRTLHKKGHSAALSISGYHAPEGVDVWALDIKNTTLKVGDTLEFSFIVDNTSATDHNLMIDYEIIYLKNNKKYSPKVYKLKKTELLGKRKVKLFVTHQIKEMTTRKYYTGRHYVRVVINGERYSPVGFFLQA